MSERQFLLLVYDIADDKRRARIAKAMEAVGKRVQGSVFEAWMNSSELEKALKKVLKHFDQNEDSLRIYTLCAECRVKVRIQGIGLRTPPPRSVVI